MVQLILRLTAPSSRGHHIVEALQAHLRRARQNAGCRSAYLAVDLETADVYWYTEEWGELSALEARVRTDHFADLLAVMETSSEPPLLEFRRIDDVQGLDYVAALRECPEPPRGPGR
jgi:quinol monooxygenase YgiN